jgi:exodeoxyribonuclease V beta subunit
MLPLNPLTLPLRGQILIEASAGTGKTYTIALLFLRLLVEQHLGVDEILVVTFTNAAAEELRSRIRLRIRDGLDVLEERADDPILRQLLAQAESKELAAILLNDALTRMDEAAIYTIHSFCQRMLQDHAFESGAPFEMELIESEHLLRARIMEDFWRQRFYPLPPAEAAWVASLWPSPADLLTKLGGHLGREDVDCLPVVKQDELETQTASLRLLFTELQGQWQQCGEELAELLRTSPRLSRDNRKSYGLARLAEALAALERLMAATALPQGLADEVELFTASSIAANLNKKKGEPPEHPFFHRFEQFWTAHHSLMNHRRVAVLLEARAYLHSELARRKREQNQLAFDDLLTWLNAGLRGPGGDALVAGIARRFPLILVDEFQDTDPLQYRIFKAIHNAAARRRRNGLFLIGDPKQAIYSFRGADIFTYLQARQDTPEHNRRTMTTNHRSSAAMVKAVGQLFAGPAPFLVPEIGFSSVEAKGKAEVLQLDDASLPALTCLSLEATDKPLAKSTAEEQSARFCAYEIATLLAAGLAGRAKLGERNLAAGDFAVLVRTHSEAELVRRELNSLGIASVCGSQDSVFAAKEARQLLTLMTSLSNLYDSGLLRTVLAGDLFGYTAEQLDRLRAHEEEWEEARATLSEYRDLWRKQGFLAMFQQLLSQQRAVSRLLSAPTGERMLTNFLHLAELLQEADRRQSGPEALLRWFSGQIQNPEEQAESQQLRLESDENLVQIVTIHKAKGMEYPLVFLPFLWNGRPCSAKEPLAFHRPDQPDRLCLDLGTASDEHLRLAERERLSEDLRLLYVALTRAKHACFFCWGQISKQEESALHYLLEQTAPEMMIKPWPTAFVRPELRATEQTVAIKAAQFEKKIDTSWRLVSYSSLTAQHQDTPPERPEYDEGEGNAAASSTGQDVFSFPKGAAAGTCLHAILEQISFNDASGHEAVIKNQLERAGFAAAWLPTVCAWMHDVLHTPLLPGFSLACLQDNERVNELSFHFPLESLRLEQFNRVLRDFGHAPLPSSGSIHGLMTGFIDLVFSWQGKYYLADYKSNHLGNQPADYGQDSVQAAMNEHRYDLQYLIYTVALHRFLARRIKGYSYEQHFGGVFYLFLRGMRPEEEAGVFAARPAAALVEGIDKCR